MSKLYQNTPKHENGVAPLLAPRIAPPRKHRDPIAYGRMSGAELRAIRKYHRLTQPQMATILATSKSTLSDWENGRYGIPLDIHVAVALLDSPKDRLGNPTIPAGLAIVNLKTNEIIRLF